MKRPGIITVICVLGYLSVLFGFPEVFSPGIKKLGLFYPVVYGVIVAAHFIACVGLWYFKRWGADLYVISFVSKVLFFILSGTAGPILIVSTLLSIVWTLFLLKYYSRMSADL